VCVLMVTVAVAMTAMSERRSRPALEALLVFEGGLSTLSPAEEWMERCGCWLLADGGRFVVERSSVECERGLRARGGLCDADQLGSQRGLLGCWMWELLQSFLGPATEECVTVLSTVFCQLCVGRFPTKPGRWCEVVQSAAECCSVLR
jgi:hypothetical protein